MASCDAEEVPIPEYYTAPFVPDRSFEHTPLVVADPAYLRLTLQPLAARSNWVRSKKKRTADQYYPQLAKFAEEERSWIKQLQKDIYNSEEFIRALQRSNCKIKGDNEKLQFEVEALKTQGSLMDKRVDDLKRALEPTYSCTRGLDSDRKKTEDTIRSLMAASKRLEDDIEQKTTLHKRTDSEVQNLLPSNRNRLMHAIDMLRHAEWSLDNIPADIAEIELTDIPQQQLNNIISEGDSAISRLQLLLKIANKSLEKANTNLQKETKDLEKSKLDLEIFSKDVTCIKRVALVEKSMKGIINFIFKAREAVDQSYQETQQQESVLREMNDEQLRIETSSSVPCDLPQDNEQLTMGTSQNALRAQQYKEALDHMRRARERRDSTQPFAGAVTEVQALPEELADAVERHRQSAISGHLRRQSRAHSMRAAADAVSARVPGDDSMNRSLRRRGSAASPQARRNSFGPAPRTPRTCPRERSGSFMG